MRTPRVAYRHLAGLTLAGTLVLMLAGGFTMAIDAGLACPGWPLCYGRLVPFLHPAVVAASPYSGLQILAEWTHRLLALVVGLLVAATATVAWRREGARTIVRSTALLALVLLPVQAGLGAVTVLDMSPGIVVVHLGVALLILCALTASTTAAWLRPAAVPAT